MLIALALVALAAPVLGQPPHWTWLLLPVVAVLWQSLGFGIGLLLGTLNVFFRDLAQVLGVAFQIWMWSLPVIYLEDFLPSGYRSLLAFNPAYPFLRALRDVFIDSRAPEVWVWASMLVWVALAAWLGFLVLGKLRAEIRDVL
jgi:lipopolysaccharide transport system permease protein